MNYTQMLDKVEAHLLQFFEVHENPPLLYHNLQHTQLVVAHAGQIAKHYQLTERDYFVVVTAAWFHDVGYYLSGAFQHEQAGAEMAADFLKQLTADTATIDAVRACIIATVMPQTATNLLEEIVCDADLFHLGTTDFDALNKLLRKEFAMRLGKKIPKSEWRNSTIKLLEQHRYKTDYAQKLLESQKAENLRMLKERAEKEEAETEVPVEKIAEKTQIQMPVQKANTVSQKDTEKPGRGIETMFRVSSNNHQRLSDMADNKAHIMITTTSIIVSVLISLLIRKLEDNPHLVIPTTLLLLICVVTMVFSILATRPSLPNGLFTRQDIKDKKVNLLFFGNFYKMSYEEYNLGMQAMMKDREFLYGSLTKDVYSQGIVLGHKYRLLRIAYNIFMYGIIASVLAFILAVTFLK